MGQSCVRPTTANISSQPVTRQLHTNMWKVVVIVISAQLMTASCSSECQEAVRTGQCDPTCAEFNDICGPCQPRCPGRCKEAIRLGQCDPSCQQFTDICGPCVPQTTVRPTPPPAEYLPPPGQGGSARAYTPNSLAPPPRSNFARQFTGRHQQAPVRT